jgi:regulator of sirC expression with transglutaminase-like and TPR domain
MELNPDDVAAYCSRGFAYHEKGEVPKAVNDLEKCIGLYANPGLTEDAQQALLEIKNFP